MKNVLFVDDEPNILHGLQRMLRPLRHEWKMRFASDGPEALRVLEEAPCDVVVTDIRMPGMSGVELVEHVRDRHPDVIRIMLSGQADRASTLAAVGAAHQYLTKPCDADTIKATVNRAINLRERTSSEAIAGIVATVDALPTAPQVYLELKRALASPDASTAAVAAIIAQDPAMTAKILQVVNSAFFGFRRQVADAQDAVQLLGFELVHALAVSAAVFTQVSDPRLGAVVEDVWRHSSITASLAKAIGRAEKLASPIVNAAMTAALLHDVGKLVLASSTAIDYLTFLRDAAERPVCVWVLETDAFGASHAEVGGYLLALWALPDPIVEAVTYHHQPAELSVHDLTALSVVHAADGLAHELAGRQDSTAGASLDNTYLAACGVQDRCEAWRALCRERLAGEAA